MFDAIVTLSLHSVSMKDTICLLFHVLTAITTLVRPSGSHAVIAENLLLKQQLIIHSRSRKRAPNLTANDRTVLGFLSVRRVLTVHYKLDSANRGSSWLTTLGHAKDSLWSIDLFRCESIVLTSH